MTTYRQQLEDAREALEQARVKLHATIITAHSEGESLRSIADAIGVSHETVRTIIRLAETEATR